jgi:hypothetical protein
VNIRARYLRADPDQPESDRNSDALDTTGALLALLDGSLLAVGLAGQRFPPLIDH